MRHDMNKVVTERTRVGKYNSGERDYNQAVKCRNDHCRYYSGYRDNFLPKQESMRKKHKTHHKGKEFSDLISPLERYLNKQVNRPWDKVWSDVCKTLKGNGVLQKHIKDHVKNYIDGIPFSGEYWGKYDCIGLPSGGNLAKFRAGTKRLYVNNNGILRKDN